MKIASIIGARPQFVKAAVVSRALRERGLYEFIIHTGQHYDDKMSSIFFRDLGITAPRYNLGIGSAPHGAQTGRMLERIEEVLLGERPDWVIVNGDTNTTLAGALAAAKLHIPVAHVEAGLRSFNRRMPEEINRILADHASDRLFAPTHTAVTNLRKEGIPEEAIHLVGDVMYDAALYYGKMAEQQSGILKQLNIASKGYILATIHRAENTDEKERLEAAFLGLRDLADSVPVVIPLHPRTKKALECSGLGAVLGSAPGLVFTDPIGYLDMVKLEKHARLVVTDSGGVQKEAFFHKVPCVTLRDETEWIELIELEWNRLAPPTSRVAVAEAVKAALSAPPGKTSTPYGHGNSGQLIADSFL